MNIHQKIDLITERLEAYKLHNLETAKISYSGGRDSHLLLHIVRNVLKYNNAQFPAVYAQTRNEYHDIRRRIEAQDITIADSNKWAKHGRWIIDYLENKKNEIVKFSEFEVELMGLNFGKKVKELSK